MAEKIKVQCQNCHRSFGGTVEQIKAYPACPKCNAAGLWWRQIETRMIQKQRLQAQVAPGAQPWQPPPPAHGAGPYVPRLDQKYIVTPIIMAVLSFLCSPFGLIMAPIGLYFGYAGKRVIAEGKAAPDTVHSVGIILCWVMIPVNLIGLAYSIFMFGQVMDQRNRSETVRRMARIENSIDDYWLRNRKYPASLSDLGEPTLETSDGWGRRIEYTLSGQGPRATWKLVSLGADGKVGGSDLDADIERGTELRSEFAFYR